jgi:hypothetical protein
VFLKSVGETVDPIVFSSCRFGLAALVGLSLPGDVRLLTWTVPAVIN